MTREEVYQACLSKLQLSNCLLLEAATGLGKSKIAIDLINYLQKEHPQQPSSMLLLVAKTVHKQTWKDEFKKWGGMSIDNVTIECYESLKKHKDEHFDYILMDEVHHIKSDTRIDLLSTLSFNYMIGLSATIPRMLKIWFQNSYHAKVVSCDIIEAIQDAVLPEPRILLYPIKVDDVKQSEVIILNPKAKGPAIDTTMKDYWKYKRNKNQKAFIRCTQKERLQELDKLIIHEKNKYMTTRNEGLKRSWLYHCGKRLEYLSDWKIPYVKYILRRLNNERTITFCKTIEQSEKLGRNCIHSKNNSATSLYEAFNQKKINHITAVNILNENANLVDCKYAILCNISSSEVIIPQRLGRAMRHPHPVIIVPYFEGTREQEIVEKMFEQYNKSFITTIHSLREI